MPRNGDWIQTYTGRQFWPLDPRAEEVEIEDIAHSLALMCRYNGHCETFYSVAEHSVRLSWIVPSLAGLFHDAAESYLGDIVRPVKRSLNVGDVEAAILAVVGERVGFDTPLGPEIKHADNVLLATESRDLMKRPPNAWAPMPEPLGGKIIPWPWGEAEARFLRRYKQLVRATDTRNAPARCSA